MTSTELKAQIDSQITNETTPNGITPTEVGTNLKEIVDYVDQEIETVSAPYKSYVALINQSEVADPTATVIYNNIGATISFSYLSTGEFLVTPSSAIFTNNKTVVFLTTEGSVGNEQNKIFGASRFSDSAIGLFCGTNDIVNLNFEIRIYN
jgi:hypothetical protein